MAIKIYIDQGHNPQNPNAGAEGNGLREQEHKLSVASSQYDQTEKELVELISQMEDAIKEAKKYVTEAIENNILYEGPLAEEYFTDRRVVLYSSNNFSLLIEHDLYLTRNRIQFVSQNIKWCNIEELINQYEIALETKRLRDIRYYRDELEMLQGFDFMWLSNIPYIVSLMERYVACLQKDMEV